MNRIGMGVGALVALSSLAGCSPEPCTSCLKVGGAYTEKNQAKTEDCHAWLFLLVGGGENRLVVTQNGSDLTLKYDNYIGTISGQLHSDNSVQFGPEPITFMPIDGAGNPDPDGTPTPGKLYGYGFFTAAQGKAVLFEGTYVFKTDTVECELDSKVRWTPL